MNSQGRRHGFTQWAGPARGMPAKLCVVALLSAWMGYRSGRASQEKVALEKMMKVKAMLPNVKRDSDMIETTPLGRADTFGDNGGVGSYLTLRYPLLLLDASTGRIKCPSKHVAFDVGTSTASPTGQRFIREMPGLEALHVFGFEANPFSANTIKFIGDKTYLNNVSDAFQTFGSLVNLAKANHYLKELRSHHEQCE